MSEAPRHLRLRQRLSSGWRKTSVNVSLAPVSQASGNKDDEASPESILNPNMEKIHRRSEGEGKGGQSSGELEPRPLQAEEKVKHHSSRQEVQNQAGS